MKSNMKRAGIAVIVATVTTVGVVTEASASNATSSSCSVKWPSTSCKTATIWANLNDHTIFYNMCASSAHYADWQIKDANSGAIVAQGRAQAHTCATGRVYGLHAAYWGWVFNARDTARAFIANDR